MSWLIWWQQVKQTSLEYRTEPSRAETDPSRSNPHSAVLYWTELSAHPGHPQPRKKKLKRSRLEKFFNRFVFSTSSSLFFLKTKRENTKLEDFYDATNNFKAICGMVYGFTYRILYVYVDITNIYWRSTRWNDEMNELFARLYLVSTSHTHTANKRERERGREHNVSYICKYIYLCRYGTRQSVRHKLDKSICSYIVMQIQSRMRDLCVFYKGQLKVQSRPWLGKVAQWCLMPICYIDNNVRSIERCS